jgi:hypothetical protein
MIDEIDELLCAIIDLCVETSGAIPFVLLESMAKFSELVFPDPCTYPYNVFKDIAKNTILHASAAGNGPNQAVFTPAGECGTTCGL